MDEKAFAIRLMTLREKKGATARDMSLTIGQNPGYINSIETGKTLPSLTGFFYMCEYLEITPQEFFDTSADNPIKLRSIMEGLKRLNDSQLNTVASVVNSLLQK